jgi:2-oxo-4-hydroxy-4-carboxy-5-ureidoimidazoline decarboxylase
MAGPAAMGHCVDEGHGTMDLAQQALTDSRLLPIAELNRAPPDAFVRLLSPAVENAPWICERVAASRPFDGPAAVLQAIGNVIRSAPREDQIRLLRGHPELAGREATAGTMTAASTTEQGRLGLDRLPAASLAALVEGNRTYRERFGFPYVVALRRRATLDEVFDDLNRRLGQPPDVELATALNEVIDVTRGRLTLLLGPIAIP